MGGPGWVSPGGRGLGGVWPLLGVTGGRDGAFVRGRGGAPLGVGPQPGTRPSPGRGRWAWRRRGLGGEGPSRGPGRGRGCGGGRTGDRAVGPAGAGPGRELTGAPRE